MENNIQILASGLQSLGLKKGDRVAFYMETRKEWLTMAHAAWRAGLTVVTVYASLGDEVQLKYSAKVPHLYELLYTFYTYICIIVYIVAW